MGRACGLALLLASVLLSAAAVSREHASPLRRLADQLSLVQEKLTKEAEQDHDASDRLGCWCQTQLQEEEKSADDMRQQLSGLGFDIEGQAAANAQLKIELKGHEAELDDNQQALATAEALRSKQAATFADDEQGHTQNINQLDGALEALGQGSGHDAEALMQARLDTSAVLISLGRRLRPTTSRGVNPQAALVQLSSEVGGGGLRARSSPAVVSGVLREMRSTFAADLEDIRQDESTSRERHEGLVRAKADQIGALKKALVSKTRRAADGELQVAQQKEQQERTSKLLDATASLVAGMKALCQGSDEAFQARQAERQAEVVALTSAQAALSEPAAYAAAERVTSPDSLLLAFSGAQLRANGREGNMAFASIIPEAEELCLATIAVVENKGFRTKAKAACEQARAGNFQAAADGAEALQESLEEEQRSVASDKERCQRAQEDAKSELDTAEKAASAQEGAIGSDKQAVEQQMDAITSQAASIQKAKTDLVTFTSAQNEVLHQIGLTAHNVVNLLKQDQAAAGASSAPALLATAAGHAEKLAGAAAAFAAEGGKEAQEVLRLIDVTSSAAARALTPLRTARAGAEEAAIAAKEDRQEREHAPGPRCNVDALAAKASALADHAKKLGDAAEKLTYAGLR